MALVVCDAQKDEIRLAINDYVYVSPNEIHNVKEEDNIYSFFSNLVKPITTEDISLIKSFYDKLKNIYNIIEKESVGLYELSIYKQDSGYDFELTLYNNSRVFIHLKYDNIEYTQYQIGDYIFQNTKEDEVIHKNRIYGINENKYVDQYLIFPNGIDSETIIKNIKNIGENFKYLTANIKNMNIEKSNEPVEISITDDMYKIKTHIHEFQIQKLNNDKYDIVIAEKNNSFAINIISNNYPFFSLFPSFDVTEKISAESFNMGVYLDPVLNDVQFVMILTFNAKDPYYVRKYVYKNKKTVFDGYVKFHKKYNTINRTNLVVFKNELDMSVYKTIASNSEKSICNEITFDIESFIVSKYPQNNLTHSYIVEETNDVLKICSERLTLDEDLFVIAHEKQYIYIPLTDAGNNTRNIITKKKYDQNIIIRKNDQNGKQSIIKYDVLNGNVSHMYDFYLDNYHIKFQKKVTKTDGLYKEKRYASKKIFRDDKLIFWGINIDNNYEIYKNELTRIDEEKLNMNKDHDYMNINRFDPKIRVTLPGFLHKNNKIALPTHERISVNDKLFFDFYYTFYINQYGGSLTKPLEKCVGVRHKEPKVTGMTQYRYTKLGQEEFSSNIDKDNTIKVKSSSDKKNLNGTIGWKAARTEDNNLCIVKLLIPNDAKIAWDYQKDKYRTNKVVVLKIFPVVYNSQQKFTLNDPNLKFSDYYNTDTIVSCPVCGINNAKYLAYPCKHKLCSECWIMILRKNSVCPHCKQTIDKVYPLKNLDLDNSSIKEAYSCVHTNDFKYKTNEMIIIQNFDNDMRKVCSNGIHYHEKVDDVFEWFEYLDIPKELLANKVPWMGNNIGDNINNNTVQNVPVPIPPQENEYKQEKQEKPESKPDAKKLFDEFDDNDIDDILEYANRKKKGDGKRKVE